MMDVDLMYPDQFRSLKNRHKYFNVCKDTKERITCVICKDVLIDPHQSECGCRFCRSCLKDHEKLEKYCPGCDNVINSITINVVRDRAIEKEILDLEVVCINPQCKNVCKLKDLSTHLKKCDFRRSKCERCLNLYLHKEQRQHKERDCRMIVTKCDQCGSEMTRKDLEEKHKNAIENIEDLCDKWKGPCPLECCEDVQENIKIHLKTCPRVTVECDMREIGCMEKMSRMTLKDHLQSESVNHMGLMMKEMARMRKEKIDLEVYRLEKENKTSLLIEEMSSSLKDLKRKVETQEGTITSLTNELNVVKQLLKVKNGLSKVVSRDSVSPSSIIKGSYEWRLENIFQKVEDASRGDNVAILSEPFYTGRHGYRLCLKMYPNGDGSARGSHVSVYFVVMRGEFDDVISWPFCSKICLTMRSDAPGVADRTVNMRPDRNDSCYGRPKSECNLAAGQPHFISHSDLRGFAEDGHFTIIIQVL